MFGYGEKKIMWGLFRMLFSFLAILALCSKISMMLDFVLLGK